MINLFDDQKEIIESTSESMRAGNKSVLMQLATGAGKTYCAAEIFRRATEKGKKTWFSVPRRQLITQTSETYKRFNIKHGFIASNIPYYDNYRAHICSLETLRRRLDDLRPPDLCVIDETHYGGAGLDAIISWLKERGTYIIGLTATPWRIDGTGLGCWYDDMVCGPSIRWLIDNKRLSDYDLYQAAEYDLSELRKNYTQKQLEDIIKKQRFIVGDAIRHYKKYADGSRNVAFCVSIEESKATAQAYNDAGIPAHHVDGNTHDDEIKWAVKQFALGHIKVLSCCELLTFGFDLAATAGIDVTVESITDLAPTQSLAKQMQKWGRALRMKSFPAIILDHAGNSKEDKHGLPCEERDWQLANWKNKKDGVSEKTIPVRTCSKCYFPHRAHLLKCPHCGHEHDVDGRTIELLEGELVKAEIKHEKKEKRMEVGRSQTIDDLWKIAKERNYKRGWVFHMAKIKGIKH